MDTTKLAKYYPTLTPWERLPLLLAASGRGDDTELQRLVATAPRRLLKVTDYYGLIQAFQEVANWHFMGLLQLAALFWERWGPSDVIDRVPSAAARLAG